MTELPLILGPNGAEALEMARLEADPESLGAASRMRRHFEPGLAAAALTQVALRRRARTKFGDLADGLFLTPDGLEQASRRSVADWRARRFHEAGITRVIDLGCGIGADALGFQRAGIAVTAVEIDPTTAALAAANLGPDAKVVVGAAEVLADELLAGAGERTGIFIDPARRTSSRRSWRMEDFRPSWDFVLALVDSGHPICVKLGPGMPRELIPEGVEACWVSDRGDTVEAGLWRLERAQASTTAAQLLPDHRLERPVVLRQLPVQAPGRYLLEPDGAVIRAGLLSEIAPGRELWLLNRDVAYLASDDAVTTPFATTFEVLETMDFKLKVLRHWVHDHDIGTVEIKKRAVDIDPAALRKQLKPRGGASATLVIARTTEGTQVLVCRRRA